jgi:hypothetical protein
VSLGGLGAVRQRRRGDLFQLGFFRLARRVQAFREARLFTGHLFDLSCDSCDDSHTAIDVRREGPARNDRSAGTSLPILYDDLDVLGLRHPVGAMSQRLLALKA